MYVYHRAIHTSDYLGVRFVCNQRERVGECGVKSKNRKGLLLLIATATTTRYSVGAPGAGCGWLMVMMLGVVVRGRRRRVGGQRLPTGQHHVAENLVVEELLAEYVRRVQLLGAAAAAAGCG